MIWYFAWQQLTNVSMLRAGNLSAMQVSSVSFIILRCAATLAARSPPWRNRLARSAVNRKVGGSSPPGGVIFFIDSLFLF